MVLDSVLVKNVVWGTVYCSLVYLPETKHYIIVKVRKQVLYVL